MSAELPSDAPAPRLCHLVKWPDFDGYGFNLHAEKAKSGQFIGKVDDDSPADHAGLKEGDRIIEVNGVNIANENHRQVVERIKAVPNETKLLVLDNEADRWFKERKVVVKSSLQNVKYIKTPVPRPTGGTNKSEAKPRLENNVSTHTNGSASSLHSETQSLADSSRSSTPKTEPKQDSPRSTTPAESPRPPAPAHAPKAQNGDAALNNNNSSNGSATTGGGGGLAVPNGVTTVISTPPPASRKVHAEIKPPAENKAPAEPVKAAAPATATTNGNSKAPLDTANGTKAPAEGSAAAGLNLNMSAAQMREMLATRKKNDPKKHTMDMREKYQIVQQM